MYLGYLLGNFYVLYLHAHLSLDIETHKIQVVFFYKY